MSDPIRCLPSAEVAGWRLVLSVTAFSLAWGVAFAAVVYRLLVWWEGKRG